MHKKTNHIIKSPITIRNRRFSICMQVLCLQLFNYSTTESISSVNKSILSSTG